MKVDSFGITYFTEPEICKLLYQVPGIKISTLLSADPSTYNNSVKETYAGFDLITQYIESKASVIDFDAKNQSNWYMPDEYKQFDIAEWVLKQCNGEAELQRAAEELMLFQDRDLFTLLQYCKYLVDTLRKNKIVLGLGRGSSVASFVLYKIGLHKINSLHYDLQIEEFLK